MQDTTAVVEAVADSVTGSWFGVNIASPLVIFAFLVVFVAVIVYLMNNKAKKGAVADTSRKPRGRTPGSGGAGGDDKPQTPTI